MSKRKPIHWDSVEKEYRMGQKTIRTIAAEFGVTAGALSKKAKKYQWVQDKSAEVRQRTKALLAVETQIGNKDGNTPTREDIEKAVKTNIEIIRGHRKSIQGLRSMVELLNMQLAVAAANREELEEEIYEDTNGDGDKPDLKRRNSMLKAVSLPAHAGVLRDLSMAMKNLIPLERQAFSIDEDGVRLEDVLAALPDEFRGSVCQSLTLLVRKG